MFAASAIQTYQADVIAETLSTTAEVLAEQGIDATQEAAVTPYSLLTGTHALDTMLGQADGQKAVERLTQTMVTDAARTAQAVDAASRPAVTGYTRRITMPACSRCVILAGRVYRYSTGFRRHPNCDCDPTPTDMSSGVDLVTDPSEAYKNGQITDLTRAEIEAVEMGADLAKVVNVRRKTAGLTVGSSVTSRAGVLTPQGCLDLASNRAQAVALLKRYGYLI